MTARLPIVGEDDGDWGTILNTFLDVSHNSDGTLQASAIAQAGGTTAINGKSPVNGTITLDAADVGAVATVFGRTGVITAQSGDYTAAQVGALSSTADLATISTSNATAADVNMNAHKITGLANGTVPTDAAALGQLPTLNSLTNAPTPLNTNTSFETTTYPWSNHGGSIAQSTTWAWNGAYSMKFTPDGSANPYLNTTISVSPSTAYTFTGMLYCPTGYGGTASLTIDWYQSDGTTYVSSAPQRSFNVPAGVAVQLSTINAVSPSNATIGHFNISISGSPSTSTIFYFDEVAVCAGASTPAGKFLRSDGINTFLSAITPGDLPASGFTAPVNLPQTYTGTTSETNVLAGPTLPANSVYNGMLWEYSCWGYVTTTVSTQTVKFRSHYDSAISSDTGPVAPYSSGTVTNAVWRWQGMLQFTSTTQVTAQGQLDTNYYPSVVASNSSTVSTTSDNQLYLSYVASDPAVSLTVNGGYWRQLI